MVNIEAHIQMIKYARRVDERRKKEREAIAAEKVKLREQTTERLDRLEAALIKINETLQNLQGGKQ